MTTTAAPQIDVESWLREGLKALVLARETHAFMVQCRCGRAMRVDASTGDSHCELCDQLGTLDPRKRTEVTLGVDPAEASRIVQRFGVQAQAQQHKRQRAPAPAQTNGQPTGSNCSKPRPPSKSATEGIPRFQEPPEILDREPPASLDAERAVISSLLIDGKRMREVLEVLTDADDFRHQQYRRVFEVMVELHKSGHPVDYLLVHDRLVANGALGDVGVAAFLQEAFDDKPTAHNARYYAALIAEKSVFRRMRSAGEELLRISADGSRQGADAAVKEAQKLLADVVSRGRKDNSRRFPIYTSAALDTMEFAENSIIENAMIEGQPGGLFGGTKMLKTMLALDAGISIASGTDFLSCNFFRVPRARRVMIMSAESGLKALQKSARRIANARGLELAELEYLLWSDRVPFLGTDADPALLAEQIKEHGVELLFLDPAYQMLDPRDSGNLFAQGIQLRRLLDVCRDLGADFQLVHHTTRHASKQYEQPALTDASWAGFSEFVGQWMLVARRDRYAAGSGLHQLWLELGARGAHQAGWAVDVDEHSDEWGRPQGWSVTVRPASEVQVAADGDKAAKEARKVAADRDRKAKRLEADKAAIIRALVTKPEGETKNTIRALSLLNNDRAVAALAALVDEKQVIECSVIKGNKRTPERAYKLRLEE